MQVMQRIQKESGCRVLLALKGFSTFSVFDEMRPYLAGCCASGVWEARLAREKFGGEVHSYSPAFSRADIPEILELSDHVVFNSINQLQQFQDQTIDAGVEVGLRINPEYSTGSVGMYDPCAAFSRLGARADEIGTTHSDSLLRHLSGFHCHTLCQQTSEPLEKTLGVVEERFGKWLPDLKWFNMGGGHHITRPDYDVDHLIQLIRDFQDRWDLRVYLEPGEAHVYDAGYLVANVLDIVENGTRIAILDVSATSHMPDVLEMPYRPPLEGSGLPGEKAHTYRLGSSSCLSGDIIGDYSFTFPLHVGDRLIFSDQAQYTMVKSTFFNGIRHPAIAAWDPDTGKTEVFREFGYDDFVSRLG